MAELSAETLRAVPSLIGRVRRPALIAGIAGLGACAVGALFDADQFFRSYLVAYLFWIGIALGCLAIVMLHHLSGGQWGLVVRRPLESATRTLPLMAVLFLPIVFGLSHLYVWSGRERLGRNGLYLNVPFFLARAGAYFAAWLALAFTLNRWSAEQDRASGGFPERRFRLLAAPGLMLFGLTVTFASIDWIMSLDPHWFSTIFGVLIMGGFGLSGLAFVVCVLFLLSSDRPLSSLVRPSHYNDLGNLMLAFVMLWAYFSFSQFLIIWSGNLPEEIPWYLRRAQGGWQWVAVGLAAVHFAAPLLVLLSRTAKRRGRMLASVAAILLMMRWVDLFWLTRPELSHGGMRLHWMDIASVVGMGGVWMTTYSWHLGARPLLPVNDPLLGEISG